MFDRRAHRSALHSMIADRQPDLAVSFNLQRALDFYKLQSVFELFMNRMQSSVDGRRWHRIPGTDRPTAIGMFEHRDSNPHIHASVYAPPRYVEFLRSGAAQELWWSCHPRCGQLDLDPVRSAKQWAGYQIKDARGPNALDNMMLYVPTVRRR
jgi:hypothetical protein